MKQAEKYIANFWEGNKGIKLLIDYLVQYYKKHGFINGLDGRKIFIRAEYKLLNSLVQSAAAIVFKRWGVMCNKELREEEVDCKQVISMHDEYDYSCHTSHIQQATSIIIDTARQSGEYYNLAVPIGVDVKQGSNWADVH